MRCRELPISTFTDLPEVRFRGFEFMGVQLQNSGNGFILSYVAIYNFEIFLVRDDTHITYTLRVVGGGKTKMRCYQT